MLGHDDPWRQWREALGGERMHHAWLLAGQRGLGKMSFAEAAARELCAEPGVTHTSCAMANDGRSIWWPEAFISVGMSWNRVPPAATFTTCRPRHTASSGMLPASASFASASSYASRTASGSFVLAWRVLS